MPDITSRTDSMTARTESMVRAAVPLRPAHVHTPRQMSQQARAFASRVVDQIASPTATSVPRAASIPHKSAHRAVHS